jgi:BlaI family penicillinase repressor
MRRPANPRPTDAELDILNILWRTGPATVRRVHDELATTKPSQYVTTLKLMQIMTGKGLLERDERERSHVYTPLVAQAEAQQQIAAHLMKRAFDGSLRSLVLGALGGRRATKQELADLRSLIEEQQKAGDKRGRKGSAR